MVSRRIATPTAWQRLLPFLDWRQELHRKGSLRGDILAGITVALVLIPQSMAYAQLAGLPAHYGLYSAFLPPIVAAAFGSSLQLATGPVAIVSLMTASALQPLAAAGSETFIAYAVLLALLVGLLQLSMGLLRLGFLVDLISHPVVLGFTNAGALIIASSQLDSLFGVSVENSEHHHETVRNVLSTALEHTHGPTLLMGLLAFAVILGLMRFAPKVPAVLSAVIITSLLSWAVDFEGQGGRIVGHVPEGLPTLALPQLDWSVMGHLLGSALTIALIGFMEAISVAKAVAARTRHRVNPDQELIGQGLGNLASGLFSGYPVSGSFSRTAVNLQAGANTGFSSVISGLMVAVTLLWLTPWLYYLPQPTLAALIIVAVLRLIQITPFVIIWRAQRYDFVVAVATFVLTLFLAPYLDKGIMAGVILSLVLFGIRSMRPRVAVLSRYHDGSLRDIKVYDMQTSPYISVVRFDGSLYFGNAGYFEEKLLEVVGDNPELRFLIIDGDGMNQIDSTGEEVLHHLARRLRAAGIEILMARMKKPIRDTVKHTGLLEFLGEDHFFPRVQPALEYAWEQLGDRYDRSNCPLRQRTHRAPE